MSDTFKGIVTADGKKRQLPYRNILDIPISDPSLTVDGGFADAAAVGKKIKKTDDEVASLKEDKVDKPSTSDDGKIPRAKEGEVEWVDVGQPTDDQTDSAVTKWLDKHPEATTTVQDGVIGEKKIEASFLPWIKKDYVTPEMFGAVGDGVHDDTNAVQYCIDNFPNILFTKTYKITKPIKIENKTGRSIIGKGATIKCIECTGFTIKESETIKIDGITLLGESKGFPAFDLYEMKWRSYIRNCCISGFSVGIKTNVFDGCLVASIENLYIIKCLYAIDDSAGGLQGTQFIGGRIENNMNGILIASPNVVFTGTIIEGNTKYDVKMINTFNGGVARSSIISFTNCYFENSAVPSIILGNDGWYGYINFTQCNCYSPANEPFILVNGDAIDNASEKIISLTNCTGFASKKVGVIRGDNLGPDTRITFDSYTSTPISEWQIGKAKISSNSNGTIAANYEGVQVPYVSGFKGANFPTERVFSKKFTIFSPDSEYSCSITVCNDNPWDENSGAGAAPGALCYSRKKRKYFIRVNYSSDNSAWEEIITKSSSNTEINKN